MAIEMACFLFGDKTLSEKKTMFFVHCQLLRKKLKKQPFPFKRINLQFRLQNAGYLVSNFTYYTVA